MPSTPKIPVAKLPPFDQLLRSSIPEASGYLRQSQAKTWKDIKEGRIAVLRQGKRTWIPNSEIVRLCSLPQQSQVAAA